MKMFMTILRISCYFWQYYYSIMSIFRPDLNYLKPLNGYGSR